MGATMKAAISERYGTPEVIAIGQVPRPVPRPGDLLVKVHSTTVSRTDCGMLQAHPFFMRLMTGLIRPKLTILGMDFAGTVATVGEDVSRFKPGDRVFGMVQDSFGTHAEYVVVAEDGAVAALPNNVGFNEAVICEGAWYADNNLEAFGLKKDQSILIYGASGAIGLVALQLSKARGAKVTAVAATRHADLIRSLGADRYIDYTQENFTAIGETFDFILDAVGKTSYFACRKLLKPNATFAATDLGPWASNIWLPIWFKFSSSKRTIFAFPVYRKGFVEHLGNLMAEEKYRAVVDRTYRFNDIAYHYVLSEQKTGIVVIEMTQD
jgi:NADPH:quinone reductase-like Zn-dependent oxidoreductase